MAASLLADLAKAPLPTHNVPETQGHAAAAYAVPPHRPPRANERTMEEPAVLLNTTQPYLSPPVESRPAPSSNPTRGGPTLRRIDRVDHGETTIPGLRKHNKKLLVWSVGGGATAVLLGLALVLLFTPGAPPAARKTAPPVTTAAATLPAPVTPLPVRSDEAAPSEAAPSASAVLAPVPADVAPAPSEARGASPSKARPKTPTTTAPAAKAAPETPPKKDPPSTTDDPRGGIWRQ